MRLHAACWSPSMALSQFEGTPWAGTSFLNLLLIELITQSVPCSLRCPVPASGWKSELSPSSERNSAVPSGPLLEK